MVERYFIANYIIKGNILLKTGLHIGDSKDSIEIGVIDNPIIKNRLTGYPFIPGSSLKGKLRTLLELWDEKYAKSNDDGKPSNFDCDAARLFGVSPDSKDPNLTKEEIFPTRLIVRDSFPVEGMDKKWNDVEDLVKGAEVKYENTIDKITSKANPRPVERIPQGSEFSFEMVLSEYKGDDLEGNLTNLFRAMLLLEDSYLGGSGSRGYGQIKFKDITIGKRDSDYYKDLKEVTPVILDNIQSLNNNIFENLKKSISEN